MKLRSKILGINVLALVLVLAAVLYITTPLVLHSQGVQSLQLFIVVMLCIGLTSVITSAWLLEAMVIRRIGDLTQRVNHIKDFRSFYEALHYTGRDEVAILATAMNQMLQRIVSSTNEVGELNAQLEAEKEGVEKLVAQRTQQLNAEKARLKASVSNLSLGFVMTDPQNNILLMNDQARHILAGVNPVDKLDAETAADAAHEWTMAEINKRLGNFSMLEQLAKSLRGGEPADYANIEYAGHILRILITPITELRRTAPLGCVIVLEDITEQKVLERSRDEFFSIASHELRTPLTAIRGNTALIREFYESKFTDKNFSEMIDDIHSSSVRLIRIVNDFLDVSRLEQGKIKFNPEAFDITPVIESVVYETASIARDKKDHIIADKTLGAVPRVYADKDRVKQVIYNLIGNALKFTDGGDITLSAEKAGSMLKVTVTDSGPGIAPADQKRLFSKYQQVGSDAYTRETSRGTGLGLYTCKLLVGRMGGEIGIERSGIGKGTAIAFTLPLYNA